MKVHGSLDVFRDSLNAVVSVPLQSELPVGLTPEIITPGRSKYEAILKGIPRQVLSVADSKISQARGFLCIGYAGSTIHRYRKISLLRSAEEYQSLY